MRAARVLVELPFCSLAGFLASLLPSGRLSLMAPSRGPRSPAGRPPLAACCVLLALRCLLCALCLQFCAQLPQTSPAPVRRALPQRRLPTAAALNRVSFAVSPAKTPAETLAKTPAETLAKTPAKTLSRPPPRARPDGGRRDSAGSFLPRAVVSRRRPGLVFVSGSSSAGAERGARASKRELAALLAPRLVSSL